MSFIPTGTVFLTGRPGHAGPAFAILFSLSEKTS